MRAPVPWPPPPPREEDDEAMVAARRMVRLVVGGLIDKAISPPEKKPESPANLDLDPPPILRE